MDLRVKLVKLRLKNPTVLASGILGLSCDLLKRCELNGAGAVTTKSIAKNARAGHKNPTVLELENGLINAIGLANPGINAMGYEFKEIKKQVNVPVIASIFGKSVQEFKEVAEKVVEYRTDAIELNVSCPNVEKHGQAFGVDKECVARIVNKVKEVAGKVPVITKLTPQAPNISEIALASEEAGSDAISAINTLGPGMVIDIESGKPMLAFKKGGLAGPAIRPVGVRCVYDIYEKVNIPIIGIGGVISGEDAIEMIQAGATAVGVGSAVYYRGVEVFKDICKEMQQWMKVNGYKNLKELRGRAHD